MPPTLILIRHAQAEHNASENYEIHDPSLTTNGLQQCRELSEHLQKKCPLADKVEHIITSPMRRTLQTTLNGLDWLIERGVRVEVDAMWQENYDGPCDTGSALESLAAEFPELDFSNVDPVYPDKSPGTPYAYGRSANAARGQACLRRLYARPEQAIAVVSHSGFLRTAISKRRYHYADYRIFTFRQDHQKGVLRLVEDGLTARRGGGLGRSPKGLYPVKAWDFPPEGDGGDEEEEAAQEAPVG